MKKAIPFLVAFCAALLIQTGASGASEYPSRHITIMVPFGPGSVTDLVARVIAEPMAKKLGQNVVVVNKGGAGGALAAMSVRADQADGYTIIMGTSGSMLLRPILYPEPFYDVSEFTAIGKVAYIAPFFLVANNVVQAKTFAELVKYIADNKTAYATGNDPSMLAAAELLSWKKIKNAVRVPYTSEANALQEGLLTGQTPWMFLSIPIARQFVEEKRIKAFATLGAKRYPGFENVPTVAELGAPELTQRLSWLGLFGPKDLPKEVVKKLSDALKEALESPPVRAQLTKLNLEVSFAPAESFSKDAASDQRFTKDRVNTLMKEELVAKKQ